MLCPPCSNSRRRGAAALELAFVLPLVLMPLVVIIADYGRVFYFSQAVTNCARNGAMYASDPTAKSPYPNIQAAALADASNLNPKPTITSKNGVDSGIPYVEVTAALTFQTLLGYPGFPKTIALQHTIRVSVAPALPDP